jgi:hypothetical protein
MRDQGAEYPGLVIRLPHVGKVVAAQQLREYLGVDLVRLDFGLGNRFGFEWITDDDRRDERSQDLDDWPRVGRSFEGNPVRLFQSLARESLQRLALAIGATAIQHLTLAVENTYLDESLVDIKSGISDHDRISYDQVWAGGARLASDGPVGNYLSELEAQPGGPRGGQLKKRAQSP